MHRTVGWVVAFCLGGMAPIATVSAHHAASSQYDVQKVVQFKGVLTKVEWVNPHTHMYFDVKDGAGKTKNWAVEYAGVNQLRRVGLNNKQSLTVGATYTLAVNPARDGRTAGLINSMTFPDGRVFRLLSGVDDGRGQVTR